MSKNKHRLPKIMTKKERQNRILLEANVHNRVLLNDLASLLNVSVDTVRRDIIELDQNEEITRIHGGAQAKSFQPYSLKKNSIYSHDLKLKIAQKAVKLIQPNSVSLISGGTTNLELARTIPHELKAVFFTPSLPIAMQLIEKKGLEVIFLGGRLSKESQISIGGNVINALSQIKFDNCFLGTSYLDAQNGLTELDWEVVQLKKAMVRSSNHVISLTISEKIGSIQRYKICDTDTIGTLVTELDPTDEKLSLFKPQGIDVL